MKNSKLHANKISPIRITLSMVMVLLVVAAFLGCAEKPQLRLVREESEQMGRYQNEMDISQARIDSLQQLPQDTSTTRQIADESAKRDHFHLLYTEAKSRADAAAQALNEETLQQMGEQPPERAR